MGSSFSLEPHRGPMQITYHADESFIINDDQPDGFESFSVSATLKVSARIVINDAGEIVEKTFEGEVFFCPDEEYQCYIYRYVEPGGIKFLGMAMKYCLGPKTFGRTLSLAAREMRNSVDGYIGGNYRRKGIAYKEFPNAPRVGV